MSRPALGPTQPLLQWVLRMLSVTVMRPQNEADRSHSSSVEVKNEWSYTSPPPYALIAGTGTLYLNHMPTMAAITIQLTSARGTD